MGYAQRILQGEVLTGTFRKRRPDRFWIRVAATLEGGDVRVAGQTRFLSVGVMFVECDARFAYGAEVTVAVRFPVVGEVSRIPATVRWVTPEGVGLSIGALRAYDAWAMHRLVELATRRPANASGARR